MGGVIGGVISNNKCCYSCEIGGPIVLTERQQKVLNHIKNDPKLSRRKLAETLDINVSAVQTHIEALRDKGAIERVGGNRGYWKIIKE